jgi:hypothetical protein
MSVPLPPLNITSNPKSEATLDKTFSGGLTSGGFTVNTGGAIPPVYLLGFGVLALLALGLYFKRKG